MTSECHSDQGSMPGNSQKKNRAVARGGLSIVRLYFCIPLLSSLDVWCLWKVGGVSMSYTCLHVAYPIRTAGFDAEVLNLELAWIPQHRGTFGIYKYQGNVWACMSYWMSFKATPSKNFLSVVCPSWRAETHKTGFAWQSFSVLWDFRKQGNSKT